MKIKVINSKWACGNFPHFLGIKAGWLNGNYQIRVGLIWWQVALLWSEA